MKAIILAGGFGTRLKKIVFDKPKSMATIAGIPFLEHQIRLLKEQGISDIILCVSYMADKIKSYFGDGRRMGVNITYSEEEVPLGTAGAIKKAERYVQGTFIVLNGDSYSQLDIGKFFDFHRSKKSLFSISLTQVKHASHYGLVHLQDDKIVAFLEKQTDGNGLINSGVYIFEPEIFKYIPEDQNISMEKQIFPELVARGLLFGYEYRGYFIDIGQPETYEKFRQDVLGSLMLGERNTLRDALQKMDKSGIMLVLAIDAQKRLLGTVTDKDIHHALVNRHSIDDEIGRILNRNIPIARLTSSSEERLQMLAAGIAHLPILDDNGVIHDVEFRSEEVAAKSFPIIRGKAPLRISFAGGGTDLPYFFDKYGGAVVSATIDKYCYATMVKRADQKILIDSDIGHPDIVIDSIKDIVYDGHFNLIKAVIKIMRPDFGFEIYLHNDVPPGRGLGSSASAAVLVASLLNNLMDARYNEYKIAEIAYKAEREELGIKGGWQDQYVTVSGGFNYMEFTSSKTIVYPLRLKHDLIHELQSHLLLCYVGKAHVSADIHKNQEETFRNNEEAILASLNKLKDTAMQLRDCLLTNHLEIFGKFLHESWEIKKSLTATISNPAIDSLYDVGLKNGAYGGKLLGAGNGGYIMFYHQPKKRNILKRALESQGGEVMSFNFDFEGTKVWHVKEKF